MQTKHESNHTSEDKPDTGSTLVYQPPRILSRERLESAANVCTGFGAKTEVGLEGPYGGTCGIDGPTHS